MIEVRKLIPQVYNQSRDFSVFTGLLQILLNESDVKGLELSKLPSESILPPGISTYSSLRGYFRFMLKMKGSIESILQALYLSGGKIICKLEDEGSNCNDLEWDYTSVDRYNIPTNYLKNVVYYCKKIKTNNHLDLTEIHINIKDQGQVNQGLFEELMYYIKPVNVIIKLDKGELGFNT